ncbi:MAG: nitroreductase family deazaflavin-dependent oxidoreductase [Chloroflexi bacterium]|nr:nitroreductase family deazaflavin-dependent oxidoreductase [Chloroflexota bacterium]
MPAAPVSHTRIRFIRPFTARVINPLTRRFAGWLPGFAILSHVGRTSGRTYHTPINVFRRGNYYLFALTYGSNVDWVKNVLAAGGCQMRSRGRDIRLVEPQVIVDPALRDLPWPLGALLGRLNRVTEILRMRAA